MKDLSWIKEGLFAHRGLHTKDGLVPENSISAFQLALNEGYGIELDVNILKDGTVVTFHDQNFQRLCGFDLELSKATENDLKNIYFKNTHEVIPKLSEVLKLVSGQVPLLIELKPKGNIIYLCEQVAKALENYNGKYAIFSFHPKVVKWFKKNKPNVIRGQISEYFKFEKINFVQKYLLKHMLFNHFNKPDFISYGINDLPNKILDRYYKKGYVIISYAAQTQEQFDHVKRHYDNVVFEYFKPEIKQPPQSM